MFRPYRVEQYVDTGGTSGTLKDIALFFTDLVTPGNIQIILPNGQASGLVITNYSYANTRQLGMTFNIDYGDSADTAVQIILDILNTDERIHKTPEPWVRVTNLGIDRSISAPVSGPPQQISGG